MDPALSDSDNNRMRLAYLVSEYPAVSHTFILREVRRLRTRSLDVRVASINSPRRPAEEMTAVEREEEKSTFYIKRAGIIGAINAHLRAIIRNPVAYIRGLIFALKLGWADLRQVLYSVLYFTEALILSNWMEDQSLSHVHVHFANPASTVGLITRQIFATGFSFTVHGPDEFYDVRGQHLSKKIAGASFVLCIGLFARSQLMMLSPIHSWSKFEVVPLGIDLEVFSKPPFRPAAETFRILCVGRLVAAKGQQVLIAAVDRLVKAGEKVSLRFVGDGPDRTNLEHEVKLRGLGKQISFEGNINQDKIGQFYREADGFALASFAEGIPVVLMEAMAMEIPCVSTMVAGIPELIRDGIDGLLVMPSDDRALAETIGRLVNDVALRRRLGEAGRRRVMEKYDLDKNVERLVRLFRTRLGEDCGGTKITEDEIS